VPKNQKQWIKQLQKEGWAVETGGNHQTKMTKPGSRPITLPEHKGQAYSKGLDAAVRKQSQEN
jgi:predicted RNA binding protein YcfA (HicA-like mRNA interferase family)